MRTNEATVNKITKILKMNIFLLFSLLFCLSVAKEELPFSLEQLLEDNPDLIKLIEKRLGSEKQSKGDANPLDESDVEDEKQEKYATAGSFSDTEGSLPNEKYPTILNTKNRDGGKCVPTVRMSSIIRSNASLKNGAKFLAKLEKRSDAECRERCCNISRCNLAVFENKEGNNCYLFDCGNPSQCRFAQNDDYIAYEYSYKSNEQSHENELDILEKPPPEQKTPVPVPQTKAPTTQKPQAIALYGSCYWGDVCADVNAICIRSQCRCKQGFYDKNGICIYTTCSRGMFECKIKESPMCLQNSKLCNGVQDCDDGMDERNCPTAGPPARNDNKKPLPHLGKPVHLPTDVHPKPDEPVINKVPQTAAPHVVKSTPAPVTPGFVETKTEKPPQTPKPVKVDTSKIKNTTTDSDTKKQETKVSTNNKENTKKTNSTNKVKAEEVPDKGDNSIAEASNGKVIVASMTNDAQGPIVALSLGLAITLMLLIFVGCRLRTVKKRIRRGKALHSNEADYLINGMYL